MNSKIIIIVPAYEPDDKLIKLLDELVKEKYNVIIIDDGSGSNYKDIFDKCMEGAHIISYSENRGKGYALKTGYKYIRDNYKENCIIVTMDCDGQHTVNDAKKLIKECNDNRESLIIGKRLRSGETPLRSRVGNSITSFLFKLVSGKTIYDTQSGLRAFGSELLDYMIAIDGNRFEYEMNVLLKCAKDNIKMNEIAITTIYINNNEKSHFKALKDSYRIYKNIFKFTLSHRRK